jgi:hypothetical protein
MRPYIGHGDAAGVAEVSAQICAAAVTPSLSRSATTRRIVRRLVRACA